MLELHKQTHLDLRNTTLQLSFHLQHQNTGTLPRESPVHDNDAPWYVPNVYIQIANKMGFQQQQQITEMLITRQNHDKRTFPATNWELLEAL
jgi:hypothetical protein